MIFYIFPVFLLSDFTGMLSEPSGIASNVAVSAHVGGTLFGFLAGAVYLLFWSKASAHRIFGNYDWLHELP